MDDEIASRYVPAECDECGTVNRPTDWYRSPVGVRADYLCDCGYRFWRSYSRLWWIHDGLPTRPRPA